MKSANILSESSGAKICKNDTAPMLVPIRKYLPSLKSKLVGAIKSLEESPVRAIISKLKMNGSCVSGFMVSYNSFNLSYPESECASTPICFKLLMMSASTLSSLDFAVRMLSASKPKVTNFFLTKPLLPLDNCSFNICEYSSRISSKSSSASGISIVLSISNLFAYWLMHDN